jgi:hypothetical protein
MLQAGTNSTPNNYINTTFTTTSGSISINYLSHPPRTALAAFIQSAQGSIDLSLHPNYVGPFAVRNVWGEVRLPPPSYKFYSDNLVDPLGLKRVRGISTGLIDVNDGSLFQKGGVNASNLPYSGTTISGASYWFFPNRTTGGGGAAGSLQLGQGQGVGDQDRGYKWQYGSGGGSLGTGAGAGTGTGNGLSNGNGNGNGYGNSDIGNGNGGGGNGSGMGNGNGNGSSVTGPTTITTVANGTHGTFNATITPSITPHDVQVSQEGHGSEVMVMGAWGDVQITFDGKPV